MMRAMKPNASAFFASVSADCCGLTQSLWASSLQLKIGTTLVSAWSAMKSIASQICPSRDFAVADDAVDVAVELVHLRRGAEAGGDGQALPERAGGGVEERDADLRVGVAVDRASRSRGASARPRASSAGPPRGPCRSGRSSPPRSASAA